MSASDLVALHPRKALELDPSLLSEAIEACWACEQVCGACADACLGEADLEALRRCVRLDLDCSDVAGVTARLLARQTEAEPSLLRAQLAACLEAVTHAGEACAEQAAEHPQCAVCRDACRRCLDVGQRLLAALPA